MTDFYRKLMKMSNLVKLYQNICIFEDYKGIYFFVIISIWPGIKFFSPIKKLKTYQTFRDIRLPWLCLKACRVTELYQVKKTHITTVWRFVATINYKSVGNLCAPPLVQIVEAQTRRTFSRARSLTLLASMFVPFAIFIFRQGSIFPSLYWY